MIKKAVKKLAMHKKNVIRGAVLVVGTMIIFFVVSKYSKNKISLIQKDEQIQTMLLSHQKSIEKLEEEMDYFRLDNESEVDEIKKKLEQEEIIRKAMESKREVENKISQQKISTLEKQFSEKTSAPNLSLIIKEWQPRIAYITCDFQMGNSPLHYGTSGSGVVIKFDNEPIEILTNRHVLLSSAMYALNSCSIKLPNNNEFSVSAKSVEVSASAYDWGVLIINNPNSNLTNLADQTLDICSQKPTLGDEIIVLGYPSIGSQNSVTATDGIISGFDGDYFITSAKVEQGNSGGAAILAKDNCFLGIPTFASLGQVESLARILDIWTIVVKK